MREANRNRGSRHRRVVAGSAFAALAMLALLALAPAAFAETFTVTTAEDGPAPCTVIHCTLRGAVEEANAAGEPSTIIVPPGFYGLEAEYANGNDLEIEAEVTIEGAGAEQVTIAHEAPCDCRVLFADSPSVRISGVTIAGGNPSGNQSGEDGADILFRPEGGGLLLLEGDVITEGETAGGEGGGVYVEEGELEMLDSTVSNNSAIAGGGVFDENDSEEPVVLERDTFARNSAEEGGGIEIEIAEAEIVNSTFNGNGEASGIGGAILVTVDGTASLLNDTLAGDVATAGTGGAELYGVSGDSFEVVNTIVGPAAAGLVSSECRLSAAVSSEKDIDAADSCGFENGSLEETDPQIEPLAANGGPTETMALKPSSPAIGAGAKAPCPATDQRGVTRPQPGDASCDIGAYEYSPPEETHTTPAAKLQPAPVAKPVAICPEVKTHAASFKPKVRPGPVVPGVRVRLATGAPSKLSVGATLLWMEGGKSQTTPLGKLAVEINQWRRVRFAIPAGLRDKLPLGTPVTVKLRIESTPRGHTGCKATLANRTIHAHVVKVFPAAVQFKRAR
jgi:CSLREA domain-containing protein